MNPQRIQRKRTKGWKMPPGAVYVGRPTEWGNPFVNLQDITYYYSERRAKQGLSPLVYCCHKSTKDAVQLYEEGIKSPAKLGRFIGGYDGQILNRYFSHIRNNLYLLMDHDLACWCALDEPCHADVLLKLANQ